MGGYGAAWIRTRAEGAWGQGPKLVGVGAVGAPFQVDSVALSGDGNTAIIGGHGDNGGAGAAWVFTRSGAAWRQQGPKLVGAGAVGSAFQGISVALSGDGNTAIVGGYGDKGGAGAAWVFARSGVVWRQQGPKLVGAGADDPAFQGAAVALSADGNTAIIGGYGDNGGAGAAWTFTRSGGLWRQQGPKLVGESGFGAVFQGISVALSGDGNTAVVRGYGDNGNAGSVWQYTRAGTGWTSLALGPGTGNCYGERVSALAQQFGGLAAAAAEAKLPSVPALKDTILTLCGVTSR